MRTAFFGPCYTPKMTPWSSWRPRSASIFLSVAVLSLALILSSLEMVMLNMLVFTSFPGFARSCRLTCAKHLKNLLSAELRPSLASECENSLFLRCGRCEICQICGKFLKCLVSAEPNPFLKIFFFLRNAKELIRNPHCSPIPFRMFARS